MWIFDKTPIFLLSARSLKLLKKNGDITVSFTHKMVKNQEIVNGQLLRAAIISALSSEHPYATTIFLDDEIIYSKIIEYGVVGKDAVENSENAFYSQIPIVPGDISRKRISKGGKTVFVATNRKLYGTILEILSGGGWRIKYVVPAELFLSQASLASFTDFKKHAKKNVLEAGNVLVYKETVTEKNAKDDEDEEELVDEPEDVFWTRKNKIQMIILVTMLLLLSSFMAWYFFAKNNEAKKQKQVVSVTPSPVVKITPTYTPTPVASSSSTLVSKKDATIQILNGSGIAGQATRAQNALVQIGFTNIETGDAQGAGAVNTIVVFSDKVSFAYKTEIVTALKTVFVDVQQEAVPDSNGFDVLITTGGEEH